MSGSSFRRAFGSSKSVCYIPLDRRCYVLATKWPPSNGIFGCTSEIDGCTSEYDGVVLHASIYSCSDSPISARLSDCVIEVRRVNFDYFR